MKNYVFGLMAMTLVTACGTAPAPITSEPVAFSITSMPKTRRGLTERTETTVRAYQLVTTSDGKEERVEVVGALCDLRSDDGSARLTTPQVVLMPKYDQDPELEARGVPPSVAISCRTNELSGNALLAAKPGEITTPMSGNIVADLVVIGVQAAAVTVKNWQYDPAAAVDLK